MLKKKKSYRQDKIPMHLLHGYLKKLSDDVVKSHINILQIRPFAFFQEWVNNLHFV